MYNHFKETGFLKHEVRIPFNEAMCSGDTAGDIFSGDFIAIRAKVHNVTLPEYEEFTLKPLQPFINKEFTHVALWFDFDMFCQVNILTILAWLDQINHLDPIDIHLVGNQFEPLEKFTVAAKGYDAIYNQVMIKKIMPQETLSAPLNKGIDLFLNYLNQDGELMTYIQKHKNGPRKRTSLFITK